MRNKGFSLIELVVALGIGSIVLLMVSVMLVRGTGLFRSENNEVNMRNDYQILRNQLDQTLMEAKTLIIEKQEVADQAVDDIVIYTGEIDLESENRSFVLSGAQTTEKVIFYDVSENSLYIANSYDALYNSALDEGKLSEGYKISDIVTDFSIDFISDETTTRTEIDRDGSTKTYYVNPVRVSITLALENGEKNDVASSFTVNLRNRLSHIATYKNAGGIKAKLSSQTVTEYNVK